MTVTGTYALEDLISGAWLHARPRLVIAGALTALLFFSFVGSLSPLGRTEPGTPVWALWAVPVSILYLLLLVPFAIPHRCRRELAQRRDFQRAFTLSANETGLSILNEVLAIKRPWSDYSKWREGRKVFLLYLSGSSFQIIPKRFFASSTDVQAFREL